MSASETPRRRRIAVAAWIAGGLVLGLAAAVAGLVLAAPALAEWWLVASARERGLLLSLEVRALGRDGARIENVLVSGPFDARIERVQLGYTAAGLAEGRIGRVALEGWRLAARGEDATDRLARFADRLRGDGASAAAGLALGALELGPGEVALDTPVGALAGTLSGSWQPGAGGRGRFEAQRLPLVTEAEGTLAVGLAGGRLTAWLPEGARLRAGAPLLRAGPVAVHALAIAASPAERPALRIAWPVQDEARARVALSLDAYGADAGDAALGALALAGTVHLAPDGPALHLADDTCARVELAREVAAHLALAGPLSLALCAAAERPALRLAAAGEEASGDVPGRPLHVAFELPSTALAGREGDFAGDAPDLVVSAVVATGAYPALVRASVVARGGDLALGRRRLLAVADVEAEAELAGTALAGPVGLRIGRITSRAEPAWVRTLSFAGDASGDLDHIDVAGQLAGGPLRAALTARLHPRDGRDSWQLVAQPVDFAPRRLRPAHLFPVLGHLFERVDGRVGGRLTLTRRRDGFDTDYRVDLQGVAFTWSGIEVAGARGEVALRRLQPPLTPGLQRLDAETVDVGLPLRDATLVAGVDERGLLRLEPGKATLWGGAVEAAGALPLRDDSRPDEALTIRFTDVPLASLLEHVDVDGLSGEGRLSGAIPLVREGGRIVVRGGRFEAPAGVLRLTVGDGAEGDGDDDAPGQGLDLVRELLRDFRFESITGSLEGPAGGTMTARFRIPGRNPRVYDGTLFELDIEDRLPLAAILRLANIQQRILRSLERRLGGVELRISE